MTHDKFTNHEYLIRDDLNEFLPYQLSMVRYLLTMVLTGTGNLGLIPEKRPERRPLLPRKAAGA